MEVGQIFECLWDGMFSVPILRHVLYPMKKLSGSDFHVSCNMGGRCVYNTHEKNVLT